MEKSASLSDKISRNIKVRTIEPLAGFGKPRPNDSMSAIMELYYRETLFLTSFEEKDIRYFKNRMEDLSKQNASPSRFRNELSRELKLWKDYHPSLRPLEPYLYALKLYANILVTNGGDLKRPYLDAVTEVILPYWNDAEDTDVLRHTLLEWNWFQSRAVVIRMYTMRPEISDTMMDTLVQKQLYHSNETELALDCLISHSESMENLKALLKFFCRGIQRDQFTKEDAIIVTQDMFKKFQKLYQTLGKDAQNELKESYQNQLKGFAETKSRRRIELMFYGRQKLELEDTFDAYYSESGEKREEAFEVIQKNWNLWNWDHQRLCSKIKDEELLNLFHNILVQIDAEHASSSLDILIRSDYPEISEYVEREWKQRNPGDPLWMPFAMANYELNSEPTWKEIMQEFFLNRCGHNCAKEIRRRLNDVRHHPDLLKMHSEILESIALQMKIPPDTKEEKTKLQNFFFAVKALYTYPFCNGESYPVFLDNYLKRAFGYATKSHDNALLDTLLDWISELARTTDAPSRYYPMLQEYYDGGLISEGKYKYRRRAIENIVKSMFRHIW